MKGSGEKNENIRKRKKRAKERKKEKRNQRGKEGGNGMNERKKKNKHCSTAEDLVNQLERQCKHVELIWGDPVSILDCELLWFHFGIACVILRQVYFFIVYLSHSMDCDHDRSSI